MRPCSRSQICGAGPRAPVGFWACERFITNVTDIMVTLPTKIAQLELLFDLVYSLWFVDNVAALI